jgi:hypothetical protein
MQRQSKIYADTCILAGSIYQYIYRSRLRIAQKDARIQLQVDEARSGRNGARRYRSHEDAAPNSNSDPSGLQNQPYSIILVSRRSHSLLPRSESLISP